MMAVLNLVAQHCANLTREDVNSLMLSWSLGGCPSPNLKLVKLFSQRPAPTVNEALAQIAREHYGTEAAAEFLANPAYMETVASKVPQGWENKNIEIVIETKLVNGNSGPPSAVATHFW